MNWHKIFGSNYLKFIVFIIFLNVNNCQRLGRKQLPCNQNSTFNEIDRIMARILPFGNPEARFAETIEELKIRCEKRRGILATLEDLNSRCMSGLMKRVVAIIIFSSKRQRKQICRKTPTKKMVELVSAGKCINNGSKEIEKCAKISINNILGIKYAEEKMKIPLLCCEFVRIKNCLISSASKNDVCTEEHVKILVRNSEQVSNGALNLACGDYTEETDKCDNLKPLPKPLGQKTPKSFIMPIIEIFESFQEE